MIDVQIVQVSNDKNFKLDTCNIEHPHDCAPITWQIGPSRTNHDQQFHWRCGYQANNPWFEMFHCMHTAPQAPPVGLYDVKNRKQGLAPGFGKGKRFAELKGE